MDEAVLDLLERLLSVRRELGERVYADAVERAVVGVGAAAHVEAERVALRHARRNREGNVVRLPRRGRPAVDPGGTSDGDV
ncbi:hypothetical protein MMB17_21095 [Methylobacterium organophilum]|uniref:hypothetical protein n=1 Tax=Methylobacterium organophilum TaxID=410 RepID=UPI001F137544|nr:hypothetical protein [Methylobacterium organophilum]UMY17114.1 hypothetical protein MMB17_21095 [Methylobacterium organophilum]